MTLGLIETVTVSVTCGNNSKITSWSTGASGYRRLKAGNRFLEDNNKCTQPGSIVRDEGSGPHNLGVQTLETFRKNEREPKYSIIIVNYNGGSLVLRCIESVLKYTHDFEIILVDNNSKDGSDGAIAGSFPAVLMIRNPANLGFAVANNIGIRRARGRHIVLLNPDTLVTSGWLERLSECTASAPQNGIACPKLMRPGGGVIDAAGHLRDFSTGFSVIRGSGELDQGQYDARQELLSCCFACALIKRSVIQDIGLLDEKMKLYFEDIDFCIRARVAGWRILYCPESLVYHHRGGLTTVGSKRLWRNSISYRLRIMIKCYSRRNVFKLGLVRVVLDIAAAASGLKNRDSDYFLGYLASPLWNLMNLPIKERMTVQIRRRASDAEIAKMSANLLTRKWHWIASR